MSKPGTLPRIRDSQAQVVAFLPPPEREVVEEHARREDLTLAQALAHAVNGELASMGIPPALSTARLRMVQRREGRAKGRTGTTAARAGHVAVSGWYDRAEVRRLRALSKECGVSLNDLVRRGVARSFTPREPCGVADLAPGTGAS